MVGPAGNVGEHGGEAVGVAAVVGDEFAAVDVECGEGGGEAGGGGDGVDGAVGDGEDAVEGEECEGGAVFGDGEAGAVVEADAPGQVQVLESRGFADDGRNSGRRDEPRAAEVEFGESRPDDESVGDVGEAEVGDLRVGVADEFLQDAAAPRFRERLEGRIRELRTPRHVELAQRRALAPREHFEARVREALAARHVERRQRRGR
mmetsp:Transcript_1743/g.5184  ORF Transcript_1743/g.5184 Transcript_1743/m.5184 type:complete len:205 (+) Transcript_1743:97-711(+)